MAARAQNGHKPRVDLTAWFPELKRKRKPRQTRNVKLALAGIERWRTDNPEHARWVEEGYPNLTQSEHIERFGHEHPRSRTS